MSKKLILLVVFGIFFPACRSDLSSPSSPVLSLPTPTDTSQLLNLKPNQKMYATIKTNLGSMRIQLFPDKAPNTVANFVGLAEGTKTGKPFYNGVIFHRVIKDFMIQGGDPLGTGTGGPGYKFADETTAEPYTRGTLAMANSGPNTNGSQFFIVHKDYPLPPNYTVFGRIDNSDSVSLATLDNIATVKTDANDRPVTPVTLVSVAIDRL